ncbi:multicopper oxidase family protein [Streptacidiphilus fuscans]|uniref:Multicopper oxidase family protein n=1 Tax=Streptacidiphilus fuscans TaxID=2789292 RepID=A0A931B021_9ACTN|nr:multicopper oxidase family protein [Streptacidiphilus fuscans]MBF9066652.1 multicopper oxidase family protein [Streptacidiphilus fuscans]
MSSHIPGKAQETGRSRRLTATAIAAATAAVVAAVFAGQAMASPSPHSTTPPSTAQQEKGMVAGRPFQDPVDADASAKPGLTITLDARQTRFDLAGRRVWGESYNGQFVAPTLRAQPGSDLTIRLVNHLPVATNLHFHGLHVSPTGDSDDPFLCVPPGKTLVYHLAIPRNHPQGTFWYHSHAMGTTCPAPGTMVTDDGDVSDASSATNDIMGGMANMPGMPGMSTPSASASPSPTAFMPGDVENQIFAGLSGALVVGDDRSLLPRALRHITAHTMVFKDAQIDSHGHIVQNTATTSINSDNPTVRLVDGQLRPVLSIRPGETQLWRLTNAGADIFYKLQLDGYRFTVIGEDGTPVAQVTTASSLLLPPGKRYDVLVTASAHPGRAWLRTLAYSNGPQGDSYPNVPLLQLNVSGRPAHPLPTVSGRIPTSAPSLQDARIAQHRTVVLSESADGNSFYIDGKQFTMGANSVFATPAKLGTVEEWTILNTSGEVHPFHLHTSAFQVMSINGVAQPYTHDQDIIPVPYAVNGKPGVVVIRVAFTDFTGRYMFHCHIAAHEDNGMMSYINVVP